MAIHAVTPSPAGTQVVTLGYERPREGLPPRSTDSSSNVDGFRQTPVAALPQRYKVVDGHSVDYERIEDRYVYADGVDGAACGSAAVAGELLRDGFFATVEGVDGHMRARMNLGGSLLSANDYLRRRGLQVETRFGGTWDELRTCLSAGFGVTVSFAHASSDHTVVLTGMFKNDSGEEFVQFQDWKADPVTGGPRLYAMSKASFLEQWDDLRMDGLRGPAVGIHRTYTLVGPKNCSFPPGGSALDEVSAKLPLTLLDAFHQLTIAPHYFAEGEVVGGIARLTSGLVEGLVQLPAAVPFALGTVLEWATEKPVAWCVKVMSEGSWWQKALAFLLLLPVGFAFFVGKLLRYSSAVVGFVTGSVAQMLCAPLRKLADWARDDDDAVETLRYANAQGTRREKENWRRLVDTPVVPGKIDLVRRMMSGHVNEEERDMIVRVFGATLNGKYTTADTIALRDAIGSDRLNAVLGAHKGWALIQGLARAPAAQKAPAARALLSPVANPAPRLRAPV